MIASLGMYDWPEVAPSTDALWYLIRDRLRAQGIAARDELDRATDRWSVWRDPALLLAQTCGMPYRTSLKGQVSLVGTPDYGLPDTPAGHYFSQIVVRVGDPRAFPDFRDSMLAYNDPVSQSGWAAVQNHAADHGFAFTRVLQTGAHRASAEAVADGRADIAGIDAVTWRLIERHRPKLAAGLRIVARSAVTPGLPLITARHRDPLPIAKAVGSASTDLEPDHRAALGLIGLTDIPAEAYLDVPTPPGPENGPAKLPTETGAAASRC